MGDDPLRIATWNLNNRGPSVVRNLGALLSSLDVDLLLAQELNPNGAAQLLKAAGMTWLYTAFDAGAPLPPTQSGRRRVAAIAGRGAPLQRAGVLGRLPLPERMIYGTVATPRGTITLASYHAPPGVSWGVRKVI